MAKRGAKTKSSLVKNRMHSISLNEKAEIIYRNVKDKRGDGWFSSLISQLIIDHFVLDQTELEKKEIILRLHQLDQKSNEIEQEKIMLAERYRKLKDKTPNLFEKGVNNQ